MLQLLEKVVDGYSHRVSFCVKTGFLQLKESSIQDFLKPLETKLKTDFKINTNAKKLKN